MDNPIDIAFTERPSNLPEATDCATSQKLKEENILHQVQLVLNHINECRNYKQESDKKAFLHDLSLLNSLAAKGYMVPRSNYDDLIYSVKSIACNVIAELWPERCRYDKHYSEHASVLYVYVGGRQYSYHTNLKIALIDTIPLARYGSQGPDPLGYSGCECIEWDGIRDGWALSDQEYREQLKDHHKKLQRVKDYEQKRDPLDNEVPRTQTSDFKDKLKFVGAVAVAKEGMAIEKRKQTIKDKFWACLESRLPASKKRNKCYINKDYWECHRRYYSLVSDMFTDEEKKWEHESIYDCEKYKTYLEQCIYNWDRKDRERMVNRLYFDLLKGKKITSDMLSLHGYQDYQCLQLHIGVGFYDNR